MIYHFSIGQCSVAILVLRASQQPHRAHRLPFRNSQPWQMARIASRSSALRLGRPAAIQRTLALIAEIACSVSGGSLIVRQRFRYTSQASGVRTRPAQISARLPVKPNSLHVPRGQSQFIRLSQCRWFHRSNHRWCSQQGYQLRCSGSDRNSESLCRLQCRSRGCRRYSRRYRRT